MTLACKTADLLSLATQVLKHLLSGQDTLVSGDERKFALTQLATAMQAAAKLADVVHMEAQRAGGTGVGVMNSETDGHKCKAEGEVQKVGSLVEETERIRAETEKSVAETARLHAEGVKVGKETERANAEAQKAGKEAERAVAETERLKAEAIMVRSVKLKIDAETERMKVEMEREAEKASKDAERAVAETQRLKAEMVVLGGEKIKIDRETERVRAGVEQAGAEEGETVGEEVERSGQVQEGHGPKPGNYLKVLDAQLAQKQTELLAVNDWVKKLQLFGEVSELKSEREREALRQASSQRGRGRR